jgi:shikimate dehydrogenase
MNVIQYLDELSESARLIGAVNTIVNTDGQLFGENTDGKGFMESLHETEWTPRIKRWSSSAQAGRRAQSAWSFSLAGAGSITIVNRRRMPRWRKA